MAPVVLALRTCCLLPAPLVPLLLPGLAALEGSDWIKAAREQKDPSTTLRRWRTARRRRIRRGSRRKGAKRGRVVMQAS
eukprot:evm.model.NODE_37709_length_4132_cov_18.755083.1